MKIMILGNGGAISNGLKYNSFIIGTDFLVETPPDVVQSLINNNIEYKSLKYIFISHVHADHSFGFPILMLRLFFDGVTGPIKIIGPASIKGYLTRLTLMAFGKKHPLAEWYKQNVEYITIRNESEIQISSKYLIKPVEMIHGVKTYGFKLSLDEEIKEKFVYLADSSWDKRILNSISDNKYIILLDMNGEPSDKSKIHISEEDIVKNAINCVHPETMFYGTHLRVNKTSNNPQIEYARPGMVLEV